MKQTTVHLRILNAGHKAEMDQAGHNFLQAVQANYKGLTLHRQVKKYAPEVNKKGLGRFMLLRDKSRRWIIPVQVVGGLLRKDQKVRTFKI